MKLVTYVGPDNGPFDLDCGDFGSFYFEAPFAPIEVSDEAGAVIAASQPDLFTVE